MGESRILYENKAFNFGHVISGIVLIVVGILVYFYNFHFNTVDQDFLNDMKTLISIMLVCIGIVLCLYNPREMDRYYVGKYDMCKLTGNYHCKGGCKTCMFALHYLQNSKVENNDRKITSDLDDKSITSIPHNDEFNERV